MSVLYCAHFCIKYSLGISNFLEEISSLSHSIVFLYFFGLIEDRGSFPPADISFDAIETAFNFSQSRRHTRPKRDPLNEAADATFGCNTH